MYAIKILSCSTCVFVGICFCFSEEEGSLSRLITVIIHSYFRQLLPTWQPALALGYSNAFPGAMTLTLEYNFILSKILK